MSHPNHYGVVIGVSKYQVFDTLNYPRNDADEFLKWLIDPGGGNVDAGNVRVVPEEIVQSGGDRGLRSIVRREQIVEALTEIRKEALLAGWSIPEQSAARLYFFASGHGIEPDVGQAALLMSDAEPLDMRNVGYEYVMRAFEREQLFGELAFFADCCRLPTNAVVQPPAWTPQKQTGFPVKSVLGFAAGQGLASREPVTLSSGQKPNGYFTTALVAGLRGSAAEGGKVDGDSLARYVRKEVIAAIPKDGVAQEPVFRGNLGSGIIFGKARLFDVVLTLPAGYSGDVWLEMPDATLVRHVPAGNKVELQLPPGNYCLLDSNKQQTFAANGGLFSVRKDVHVAF